MPVGIVDGKRVLGKTMVFRKYKMLTGKAKYPLMQSEHDAGRYEATKSDSGTWATVFESLGFKGAEWDTEWMSDDANEEPERYTVE
jgi:hypothetical protein